MLAVDADSDKRVDYTFLAPTALAGKFRLVSQGRLVVGQDNESSNLHHLGRVKLIRFVD